MASLSDSTDFSEYDSSDDDLGISKEVNRAESKRREKAIDLHTIISKLRVEIHNARQENRRPHLSRSLFQTIMFLCGVIPRFFVMYVMKLEEGVHTRRQKNLQFFKLLLPLISSSLTVILALDGSIFMQLRFIVAIMFTLLGATNFIMLILHKRFFGITFTMPAIVMNGLADIIMAILILIFKSKWPFKRRRC